jgi:uncharacterized membrane protein YfcA
MQRNKNAEKPRIANEYDVRTKGRCGVTLLGVLPDLGLSLVLLATGIAVFAGFVKGAVGFAMPMILISGLGSVLPFELAVAALILPTVMTNILQAFRNGLSHAVRSFLRYWRFNLILFLVILLSAQLVTRMPQAVLFVLLGAMIAVFAVLQLAGWRPRIRQGFERITEFVVAVIAGFFGGLTGVWGPPTVMYLTALDVPKAESVRVQGVMYLMGSVLLLGAHLKSGVLNSGTIPLSAGLVIPALVGQGVGMMVQDRMDQALFRRVTLAVLVIAGLNLLRRGILG